MLHDKIGFRIKSSQLTKKLLTDEKLDFTKAKLFLNQWTNLKVKVKKIKFQQSKGRSTKNKD